MGKEPEKKNMGSSDREILDKATCTIEIGGKSYVWVEVGRRKAREMLADIAAIMDKSETSGGGQSGVLAMFNECLEWFYRWNPIMRNDKATLDDNATNDEIIKAFRAVREVLDCPFRRDMEAAREKQMSTPNPESSS